MTNKVILPCAEVDFKRCGNYSSFPFRAFLPYSREAAGAPSITMQFFHGGTKMVHPSGSLLVVHPPRVIIEATRPFDVIDRDQSKPLSFELVETIFTQLVIFPDDLDTHPPKTLITATMEVPNAMTMSTVLILQS
jgi:hypothetical protein